MILMPYILVNKHRRFGRLFYSPNGGNNKGIYLPACTASHSWRLSFSNVSKITQISHVIQHHSFVLLVQMFTINTIT